MCKSSFLQSCSVIVILGVLCPAAALGQDEAAATQQRVTEHWLGVVDEFAKGYEIRPLDQPDKPFLLHESAIFRHTQAIRGDDIGAVYLWKQASGRPAAIGVVFAWSQGRKRRVQHEFHSLHSSGIAMAGPGNKSWKTEQPGVQWKPFPDAGTPHESPLRRKLEAKTLARRVSAYATDPTKSRWELRQVPTPIYEYSMPDEGVAYGAIFSLCQGTDTELLVLLEARTDENADSLAWHYAFAPFTDYQLAASIDEAQIWKSPSGSLGENGKPHYWDSLEQRAKPDFEP